MKKPQITLASVVFSLDPESRCLKVLLERGPQGYSLPETSQDWSKGLKGSVLSLLEGELESLPLLEQLRTTASGGPPSDTLTVSYLGLVPVSTQTKSGSRCTWHPLCTGRSVESEPFVRDHAAIINAGVERLQSKIQWQPIGLDLLPLTFTLTDLQAVYETILGRALDKRNFRRKVLSYGVLESAESVRIGQPGRPPSLYRFNREAYEELVQSKGLDFEVKV